MSNFIKSLVLIILGATIFYGNSVFADTRPSFETLDPEIYEDGIVRLRASFDDQGIVFNQSDAPRTWFEFGDDANNLNSESERRSRVPGNYVVSQGATSFRENTTYYVQAMMRFDGETHEGDIISFDPYRAVPISFGGETTQTNTSGENSNSQNQNQEGQGGIPLQPPLNHSFNFLDFSQFRSNSNTTNQNQEEKDNTEVKDNSSEKKEVVEPSNFENSASNTEGEGEMIVDEQKVTKAAVTASAFDSNTRIGPGTYLTTLVLLLMLIAIAFLWRLTNKKKRSLYQTPNVQRQTKEQYQYRYNEQQYPYAQA
ncbi:MAG: hypothetical protein MRY57_00185 [Candidatus Pacebacteria bacterium]|nr:hypothetical protein [Candidatus Paceibacterota bacterium]